MIRSPSRQTKPYREDLLPLQYFPSFVPDVTRMACRLRQTASASRNEKGGLDASSNTAHSRVVVACSRVAGGGFAVHPGPVRSGRARVGADRARHGRADLDRMG